MVVPGIPSLLVLTASLWAAELQEREAPEYDIKAAFLYNFATFVEWPTAAFPDKESPFVIGVLGQDPFGPTLEDTLRGKTVGGRKIAVKRSDNPRDLGGCQLLFVPGSEWDKAQKILESLKGTPTLTVGEQAGFAAKGGIVNFFVEGKYVRFEINPEAAKRASLKVSSKLLRLARVVEDKE
jgi:hypothetical protein